jgi:DNA-directed RNA polymerase subunit RPC12/RpoP
MPSLTQKELLQLEYDKKQTQFTLDGSIIINQKIIDDNTPLISLINESNFYICPFCLNNSNKFIIENKGLIKCPNCSNFMRMKTLVFVKDCTNQEYAKWVYEYRLSGFFKKINFEQWAKKLKDLGISYEFWEEYKKLKGEYEEEEKENIDYEVAQIFIGVLIDKINSGLTKEQIVKELIDVSVSSEMIEYCYNEAQLKIKNGV